MKSLEEATAGAVQSFCKGRPETFLDSGRGAEMKEWEGWIGSQVWCVLYLWWLLAKGSRGAVINTPAIFISKQRAVGCYRCLFTGEDGRENYYLQQH